MIKKFIIICLIIRYKESKVHKEIENIHQIGYKIFAFIKMSYEQSELNMIFVNSKILIP